MQSTTLLKTRDRYGLPLRDEYGYLNTSGLYSLVEDDLEEKYEKLRKKKLVHHHAYPQPNKFKRIALRYLKHVFSDALESLLGIQWYPAFGKIIVVRSKCTKYLPESKNTINGEVVVKKINMSGTNGYFTHFMWKLPKIKNFRSRMDVYDMRVGLYWKKKIVKKIFDEKKEYLYFGGNVRRSKDLPEKTRPVHELRAEDGHRRTEVQHM